MKIHNTYKGITLVELMVVVTIMVIVSAVGVGLMNSNNARNELINHLKFVRATFIQAKAKALETTSSVKMSLDGENRLTVIRDQNRDGNFTDSPDIVIGQLVNGEIVGQSSFYKKLYVDETNGGQDLPFWFQAEAYDGSVVTTFPSNSLVISPDGRVYSDSLDPSSGTFFFRTNDSQNFGAIHITAMGEVRLALRRAEETNGDFNGWKWLD